MNTFLLPVLLWKKSPTEFCLFVVFRFFFLAKKHRTAGITGANQTFPVIRKLKHQIKKKNADKDLKKNVFQGTCARTSPNTRSMGKQRINVKVRNASLAVRLRAKVQGLKLQASHVANHAISTPPRWPSSWSWISALFQKTPALCLSPPCVAQFLGFGAFEGLERR